LNAIGTGTASYASAPRVSNSATNSSFRGVGEAAQGGDFIKCGVLITHANGTKTTFQSHVCLTVGALGVATAGANVKMTSRSGQAVVLGAAVTGAHAKQCAVGGAHALLGHEVGFHAAAEVFRATEANAATSIGTVHDAGLLDQIDAGTALVGFHAIANVGTTINGGLSHHGASGSQCSQSN